VKTRLNYKGPRMRGGSEFWSRQVVQRSLGGFWRRRPICGRTWNFGQSILSRERSRIWHVRRQEGMRSVPPRPQHSVQSPARSCGAFFGKAQWEMLAQARALRHALASTFPAGAIVVFIPWCRGAEPRAGESTESMTRGGDHFVFAKIGAARPARAVDFPI
jgi:hypothetical protein